jgi:hypothetical protein
VGARISLLAIAVACTAVAATAIADVRVPVISNFGREIDPKGRLVELNRFPAGSALTPNGRFIWTVGGAGGPTRITDLEDGSTVQEIPGDATNGGIAFAPNGTRAYLSSAGDHIRVYDVDPGTGRATKLSDIAVPADRTAMPPDNLPPMTPDKIQSYPEGLAVSADGKTVVAALNLSDRVAIVNTATKAVRQVVIRQDTSPGNRAMPYGSPSPAGRLTSRTRATARWPRSTSTTAASIASTRSEATTG